MGIVFYAGCKDTITNSDIDNRDMPTSNVSYNKDIQPVFEYKCNSSNCHDDGSRKAGLSFTSYQNTTSDPTVVIAGHPETSRLVWAINPTSSNPMPPLGYPPLTKKQIDGITTWIKEGAKPN